MIVSPESVTYNERTGVAPVYARDFLIIFFKYAKSCCKEGAKCSSCPYRTRNNIPRCSAEVPVRHLKHLLTVWTVKEWSCAREVCAVHHAKSFRTAWRNLCLTGKGDSVLWQWSGLKDRSKNPPTLFHTLLFCNLSE